MQINVVSHLRKKSIIYYTIIVFLNIILTIIFTYPSAFNLNTRLIGDGGDNYEYLTYQFLAADNLKKGFAPLAHTDKIFYPVGTKLSVTDGMFSSLTGGLFNFLFSPSVSYNLTVLLVFVLNGVFSFIFFYKATGSDLGGCIGMYYLRIFLQTTCSWRRLSEPASLVRCAAGGYKFT
jgi:hypothetical protein